MSNGLAPDPARRSVGPDLGSDCLQRLPPEDTIADRDLIKFSIYICILSDLLICTRS